MRKAGGREDVSAGDSSLQASSCKAGGISAAKPLSETEGGGVIQEGRSPFGKGAEEILPKLAMADFSAVAKNRKQGNTDETRCYE